MTRSGDGCIAIHGRSRRAIQIGEDVLPTFTNNTAPGNQHAIVGVAEKGIGVHGTSSTSTGTGGVSESGIGVHGVSKAGPGVRGDTENGVGVWGGSKASSGVGGWTESGIGVHGVAKTGIGIRGDSETWQGVYGHSTGNAGVVGESTNLHGVFGICHNPNGGGVYGTNDAGGFGVQGESKLGRGLFGYSESGEGVRGETNSATVAAIAGFNLKRDGAGAAIYGKKEGEQGHAGFFDGNVHVTRNITVDGDIVLANADCAEDFDIEEEGALVLPGTVMVLGDSGALRRSHKPYDRRVVGVVSGAGRYRPGIVLDRQRNTDRRRPIALFGKVYCQVDADHGPIAIGDLLTTSSTLGHAMAVVDFARLPGTMIGKAMGALASGRGLIPVLVTMR